jgi:hypothetical protein
MALERPSLLDVYAGGERFRMARTAHVPISPASSVR